VPCSEEDGGGDDNGGSEHDVGDGESDGGDGADGDRRDALMSTTKKGTDGPDRRIGPALAPCLLPPPFYIYES
jgi:hypothetical protein